MLLIVAILTCSCQRHDRRGNASTNVQRLIMKNVALLHKTLYLTPSLNLLHTDSMISLSTLGLYDLDLGALVGQIRQTNSSERGTSLATRPSLSSRTHAAPASAAVDCNSLTFHSLHSLAGHILPSSSPKGKFVVHP